MYCRVRSNPNPNATQLSLFPTVQPRRQHHINHGDHYRVWLGTVQWQRRREQTLDHDDYRCQNCGSDEALVVHHTTYARVGDEWPEDLTTLCRSCHEWEHQRRVA